MGLHGAELRKQWVRAVHLLRERLQPLRHLCWHCWHAHTV
jgi:hypothetical protein